jgi:hypothetical protein
LDGLVGIVALIVAVAKKTPIQDQVNVFRKSVNQSEDLGKARAAFEDHLTLERRFGKEVFENPANPEVLFDDGGIHAEPACRLAEQIPPVFGWSGGDPIHEAPIE